MRRRNSLLEAVEMLRRAYSAITVSNIVLLLYVAENEGLTVRELSQAGGYNTATTSRALRAMAEEDAPGALGPKLGWVRLLAGAYPGTKAVVLTSRGREMCRKIDAIISAAVTIST